MFAISPGCPFYIKPLLLLTPDPPSFSGDGQQTQFSFVYFFPAIFSTDTITMKFLFSDMLWSDTVKSHQTIFAFVTNFFLSPQSRWVTNLLLKKMI